MVYSATVESRQQLEWAGMMESMVAAGQDQGALQGLRRVWSFAMDWTVWTRLRAMVSLGQDLYRATE